MARMRCSLSKQQSSCRSIAELNTWLTSCHLSSSRKPKAAWVARRGPVVASSAPAPASSEPEVEEGGEGGAVAVHRLVSEQQCPQRHGPTPQPHLQQEPQCRGWAANGGFGQASETAAAAVAGVSSAGAAGSTHLGVCRQAQRAGEGHAPPARHPLSSCRNQRGHHHCRHSSQHGGTTVTVQKKCGFHAHRRLQWQQQPQAGPTHLRWPPPVQPAGQAQPAEGPRTCRACTTGL